MSVYGIDKGLQEIHQRHGTSSTDSLLPYCRICKPRWEDVDPIALDPDHDIIPPVDPVEAINYDLAGRPDVNHMFADFRSPGKARKRHRQRNRKYYSFRGVKAGQLGRPHYVVHDGPYSSRSTLLFEAPVETMTKERLYREAQMYPSPPKQHRSRPWEKLPWGTNNRYNGRKHALQRFSADLDEVFDFARWRVRAKAGFEGDQGGRCDWTPVGAGEEFGYALCLTGESGAYAALECGCGCDVCHRECHEQVRREREAEAEAEAKQRLEEAEEAETVPGGEDGEEGREVLSVCSDESAGSQDEWEILSTGTTSDIDKWTLVSPSRETSSCHPREPQTPINAFTSGHHTYFDADGYLPYTHEHFVSDLVTSRCRACIAAYITSSRLQTYDAVRLSDIAFLRPVPESMAKRVEQVDLGREQMLPVLAELDGRGGGCMEEVEACEVMTEGRGVLAGQWYAAMAPVWWSPFNLATQPKAAGGNDDLLWMLYVGVE